MSCVLNLGVLGFFKYFGFFVGSATRLLATLGAPVEPVHLEIVLPIGISFYTFHSLSYIIDIFSLSTWPRDYLYIPLGGNRLGPGRTYRNLYQRVEGRGCDQEVAAIGLGTEP